MTIVKLAELAAKLTIRLPGKRTEANKRPDLPAPDSPFAVKPLNLEQLRKQARELLRGWQAGDETAIARLAAHPDPHKITQSRPQLCDAQLVIARELGFSQWARLKQFIEHDKLMREAERRGEQSVLDKDERTLHIAIETYENRLALAGFEGDFLFFPIPRLYVPLSSANDLDQFAKEYSSADSHYWKELIHTHKQKLPDEFEAPYGRDLARFEALKVAKDYDRVCLWFGPNQSESLSMAFLMNFLSDAALRPRKLELIFCTGYPGVERLAFWWQLPPIALRVLWQQRRLVDEDLWKLGRKLWRTLIEPTPLPLFELVQNDLAALPDLKLPLLRHLQSLPALTNGLSLPEQTVLETLAAEGPMNGPKMVRRIYEHFLPLPGSTYWPWEKALIDLSCGPSPALQWEPFKPVDWGRDDDPILISITDTGRKLLANELHWMDLTDETRTIHNISIDPQKPHWCWEGDKNRPALRMPTS